MLTELAYVALLLSVLLILAAPTGRYIGKVFAGELTIFSPLIKPIERAIYKIADIDESREMHWKTYVASFLIFKYS